MKNLAKTFLSALATVIASRFLQLTSKTINIWTVECVSPDGKVRWSTTAKNLTVNSGLNDKLDKYFRGTSYTAAWYIGLMSSSPSVAASDTMASHGGWTEVTTYSELARQTFTPAAAASQSLNNSASVAEFTMNASGTVGGAFLTTSSTKGGSAGILYGALPFAENRTVGNGDILRVSVSITEVSG